MLVNVSVNYFLNFHFLILMLHLFLEGFLLDKKVGINQPKRIENARILIANTPMDADKIKVEIQQKF